MTLQHRIWHGGVRALLEFRETPTDFFFFLIWGSPTMGSVLGMAVLKFHIENKKKIKNWNQLFSQLLINLMVL